VQARACSRWRDCSVKWIFDHSHEQCLEFGLEWKLRQVVWCSLRSVQPEASTKVMSWRSEEARAGLPTSEKRSLSLQSVKVACVIVRTAQMSVGCERGHNARFSRNKGLVPDPRAAQGALVDSHPSYLLCGTPLFKGQHPQFRLSCLTRCDWL